MLRKKLEITTEEKVINGFAPDDYDRERLGLPQRDVDPGVPERDQWGNKAEFLLSCISLSVGLGNVWRFPYLAYANGGGAFLIPYICILFLVGKPMYFMEIALGQYHSQGPVKVWKNAVPFATGIGFAQVLASLFVAIFYVIIMAWTLYYFGATFMAICYGEPTPWANFCDNDWAHKPTCIRAGRPVIDPEIPVVEFIEGSGPVMASASQQYYDRAVMMKYNKGEEYMFTISDMGDINLYLLACLAGSWFIVFLSLIKGVKSSGKVVYITSTMPFIVLFILLGRGASLPGAADGMKYFIVPKFQQLLNIQTWKAAAEQMFFSLSVAFGSLTMLGSYNKFNNNCYQDGVIVSILDSATSIISGLAMFSVLGYLAGQLDTGVENVVSSGPGLAFVTFPAALNEMPVPHLWAILFFIMLYTLGLGSEIGLLENVLSFIVDKFPALRARRPLVAGIGCSALFLVGLPFITQGGHQLFDIFNEYAGGLAILVTALFEVIMLIWVYGLKRFVDNLKEMIGKSGDVSYYYRTAWICLSPLTLTFILIVALVMYQPMSTDKNGLPAWVDGIGWVLMGIVMIQLPIWAVVAVYRSSGHGIKEKLIQSLWPDYLMTSAESRINGNATPSYLSALEELPPAFHNKGYDPSE